MTAHDSIAENAATFRSSKVGVAQWQSCLCSISRTAATATDVNDLVTTVTQRLPDVHVVVRKSGNRRGAYWRIDGV